MDKTNLIIKKDNEGIKIFINKIEIPNVKSFEVHRDDRLEFGNFNYLDINLKILIDDIRFIDESGLTVNELRNLINNEIDKKSKEDVDKLIDILADKTEVAFSKPAVTGNKNKNI